MINAIEEKGEEVKGITCVGKEAIAIFKRAVRTGISNIVTIESKLAVWGKETLHGEGTSTKTWR